MSSTSTTPSSLASRLGRLLSLSEDACRDLEEPLTTFVASARATWPTVGLDDDALLARVSEIVGARSKTTSGTTTDLATEVRRLHPDVLVAVAGARHDPAAVTEIDRLLRDCAKRVSMEEAPSDELALEAREQLFVPDAEGRPAKLTRYSGSGSIKRWLEVLVTRAALTMQRRARRGGMRRVSDDVLAMLPATGGSGGLTAETEALRNRYGEAFRESLRDALQQLSPEERNLLRFHFVDGLGLDRLAPLLGVHRATAARKLARAKDVVLEKTREALRQRIGINDAEFSSLVAVLLSRVEVEASFLAVSGGGASSKND